MMLGYGVIGGIGLGLGYVSPVSTLIKWFPDRRGMATGLAIMGFGGGAMIAAPLNECLIRRFYQAPEYVGAEGSLKLVTDEGIRYADLAGRRREVVIAGANDVAKMTVPGPSGAYLVGTGRVGVTEAFIVLGAVYSLVMALAAMSYRVPAGDWRRAGWTDAASEIAARRMISSNHVSVASALKSPQFYQLWIMLCLNVTAGIAVLGVAKTMMTDIRSTISNRRNDHP